MVRGRYFLLRHTRFFVVVLGVGVCGVGVVWCLSWCLCLRLCCFVVAAAGCSCVAFALLMIGVVFLLLVVVTI